MISEKELKEDITSKKNIQKLIRIWKYKTFLHRTDFNSKEYLFKLDSQLEKVFAPITSIPSIPSPKKVDRYKLEDFIHQFKSDEIRNTAKKIIENHLQYYSFQDFENRLKKSVDDLNMHLIRESVDVDSISLLIEPGHSSEWVASLASRYLNFVPKNYITYDGIHSLHSKLSRTFSRLKNDSEHTIIIFDDWSISGRQLSQIINFIGMNKLEKLKLNIIVVVPLMTKYAYNLCKEIGDSNVYDINLKFLTSPFIPSLEDVKSSLSEQEQGDFNEILGFKRNDNNLKLHKNVMAFSDWKIPDAVSMPELISNGRVPHHLSRYYENNKFLPEVTPPYHKNYRRR